MSNDTSNEKSKNAGSVRRIVHIKFAFTGADPAHLRTMLEAATPYLKMFGGTSVVLLQNVDDPARFIQVIEYETSEAIEINRQRLASNARLQTYLQAWRAMLPGGVEIDVYRDVAA
jgi:hypothetical protein